MNENLPFHSFEKRIALIKNDIFSEFASSNDYSKVSFYKVLDRLVILIQYAVCFVLYKENSHGKKNIYFNFLEDPLYSSKIKEKIDSISKDIDKYLFRIFDTEYYLLVFKIEKINQDTND